MRSPLAVDQMIAVPASNDVVATLASPYHCAESSFCLSARNTRGEAKAAADRMNGVVVYGSLYLT